MRFRDLGMACKVPDANTLWDFREASAKAGVLDDLFAELERMADALGFVSKGGHILDSTLAAAHLLRASAER